MLAQEQRQLLEQLMPKEFWDAHAPGNQKILNACINLGIQDADEIAKVIDYINVQTVNLFFAKIIEEFTPEQKKAFKNFMVTKPTTYQILATLTEGFKRKYQQNVTQAILTTRNQFIKNFFTNLALIKGTEEKIQALSAEKRQELLEHIEKGRFLNFLLTLAE